MFFSSSSNSGRLYKRPCAISTKTVPTERACLPMLGSLFFSADTPKIRLRQRSNFQFLVLPLHIQWRGPKIKRDLLATPFQYLFLVYCSVEKLMHQRPNPIHFFFQREMARVEKMELCTGNISFKEFSTLHRKDSIVFAPSDQRGGLLFTELLLPIGIDIQIPFCVVED